MRGDSPDALNSTRSSWNRVNRNKRRHPCLKAFACNSRRDPLLVGLYIRPRLVPSMALISETLGLKTDNCTSVRRLFAALGRHAADWNERHGVSARIGILPESRHETKSLLTFLGKRASRGYSSSAQLLTCKRLPKQVIGVVLVLRRPGHPLRKPACLDQCRPVRPVVPLNLLCRFHWDCTTQISADR